MYRRLFAMILAFVMVFSMLPGAAMATDEAPATEPVVTEPQTTEPKVTEPVATEPKATEPKATEPAATEPKATEPKATEPAATEPKATEPKATEPAATEPKATEPKATEPAATEPKATEPQATEPAATEPQATQPAATEPAPNQKIKFTSPGKRNTQPTTITAIFTFEFPEESGLTEDDLSSITVELNRATEEDWELWQVKDISDENNWTASFSLAVGGTYCIDVDAADQFNGYFYTLESEGEISLETGESVIREYTIRYMEAEDEPVVEEEATLTVSLAFAEGSAFGDADIGAITANIYDDGEELVELLILTQENGRTVTTTLRSGEYYIEFTGYEKEGYVCNIDGERDVCLENGDNLDRSYTLRYEKDEATLTVSLAFAEGSAFGDADIGSITAKIYPYDDETGDLGDLVGELILTQENGRTATATLPSGNYNIKFYNCEMDGYCYTIYGGDEDGEDGAPVFVPVGEEQYVSRTIKYVKDEATLTVSLFFEDGSAFGDADIGSITAKIYPYDEITDELGNLAGELTLTQENDRMATATLPSGSYRIKFSDYEKAGYVCSLDQGSAGIYLSAGEEEFEFYSVNYVNDEAKLTVSLAFAEGSAFGDADIGSITAKIYPYDDETGDLGDLVGELILTQENGRTAGMMLPSGEYVVEYSGYEKEGYVCNLEDGDEVYLHAGTEEMVSREVNYIEDEATLTVILEFEENSKLGDEDIGDIVANIYSDVNGKPVGRLSLTQENGRTASITLPSGDYLIEYSGYEKDGYHCDFEATEKVELIAGEETSEYCYAAYNDGKSEISVALSFAEDSALGDTDVGDITAQIYCSRDGLFDEEPIGEILLSQANGRKGQITLQRDPAENVEYNLKIIGGEVQGYRAAFTGSDYSINVGESGEWKVIAKYMQAERSVTVNVRLSEESDVPATELNGRVIFTLEETREDLVSERITHDGSTVFHILFPACRHLIHTVCQCIL